MGEWWEGEMRSAGKGETGREEGEGGGHE